MSEPGATATKRDVLLFSGLKLEYRGSSNTYQALLATARLPQQGALADDRGARGSDLVTRFLLEELQSTSTASSCNSELNNHGLMAPVSSHMLWVEQQLGQTLEFKVSGGVACIAKSGDSITVRLVYGAAPPSETARICTQQEGDGAAAVEEEVEVRAAWEKALTGKPISFSLFHREGDDNDGRPAALVAVRNVAGRTRGSQIISSAATSLFASCLPQEPVSCGANLG